MFKSFEALTSGDTLELRMYGPIGGGIFSDGISADSVSRALDQAKDARKILVRLSSPGGAAFDGMAIRAMLSTHPAKVTCEIEGLAASAASIVAMGADVIKMHEGSAMMVHRASVITGGDVAEHAKAVNALTALDDGMASVYAARSGMSKDDCVHMMEAETWLTAEQAVAKKLADEVVPAKKSSGAPTAFDMKPFGYRHAPQQFTAAAKPAPQMEIHMSLARIATALGLPDSAEEAAVIAALGKFQSRKDAAESALNELRAVVSAETNEALLGALRGLQSAAAQLPELKAKVEEQQKAIEGQERAALFAADAVDTKGRKLTPALVKLFESKSPAEIKAFLDVAPHIVVVSAAALPAGKQPVAAVVGTAPPDAITHNGKAWEQLTAAEKHDLHVDDIAAYKALRDNHIARGKPRAQAQQQRASA